MRRPTVAAIRKAVLDEPDMDVLDLMDELVPMVDDDSDSGAVERRFDVLYWAVDKGRAIREVSVAKQPIAEKE